MNPANSKSVVMYISPSTFSAAATHSGQIDTQGFDYLVIDAVELSHTSALILDNLELTESDTALTSATSGSAIVAFTGAAAISTSAAYVTPTPSSSCNNHYRFNVDLKGRKRYIGFYHNTGTAAVGDIAVIGTLYNCQDGPAAVASTTLANTALVHQQRLIVSG